MRLLSALLAVVAAVAPVAGQSRSLPPLVVVRLDDGSGRRTEAVPPEPAVTSQEYGGQTRLSPLPVTRLEEPGASAILDAGRPLSLRLGAPMPLRDILLLLVRDTGLSLVMEPGVEGTFVGEMHDLTLRQALDLVLKPIGLDYSVEGVAVHVFKRRVETRFIDVNVALAIRRAEGAISGSLPRAADDRRGSRASVAWSVDADPFEGISDGVRSLLSADGTFSLDRRSGVVEITDYPERLDRVALYLESIERRLHRQVELQARLVEVTLNDPAGVSVNWDAALQKSRVGSGAMDFDAFVKALRDQGTVAVLASPRVVALHNEPAQVRIATGAGEEFALAVTPHISADGTVMLALSPSASHPTGEMRAANPASDKRAEKVPVLATNEMTTAVRLRDGDTVIFPGLLHERTSQVRAESQGFAALFTRDRPQVQTLKSEAAVLVTSRVVMPGGL